MAKRNLHNKINAAFSAYYGMGFLLGGVILVVGMVMGGIGYSLLRVADEEVD